MSRVSASENSLDFVVWYLGPFYSKGVPSLLGVAKPNGQAAVYGLAITWM